jgi:hypothetical protein
MKCNMRKHPRFVETIDLVAKSVLETGVNTYDAFSVTVS